MALRMMRRQPLNPNQRHVRLGSLAALQDIISKQKKRDAISVVIGLSVANATVAAMALLLAAGLAAANPETVTVQVTFVNSIAISEVNALQFGSLDQNLANLESVTAAPDSVEGGTKAAVEAGPQTAASLTVAATPGKPITILVDGVVPGAGYSLADFRCNYNAGTDTACDGVGSSETSVASGTLLVGATLTGGGTAAAGAAAGSFTVTVVYQ